MAKYEDKNAFLEELYNSRNEESDNLNNSNTPPPVPEPEDDVFQEPEEDVLPETEEDVLQEPEEELPPADIVDGSDFYGNNAGSPDPLGMFVPPLPEESESANYYADQSDEAGTPGDTQARQEPERPHRVGAPMVEDEPQEKKSGCRTFITIVVIIWAIMKMLRHCA